MPLLAPMQLAYLLQTHDVRVKLFHRMAQVMNFKPALWPDALHALVDVIGRNTNTGHCGPLAVHILGSNRQASAFEGE